MTWTEEETRFIAAMKRAVKDKGRGYRYHTDRNDAPPETLLEALHLPACEYVINGEGACIIGRAIQLADGKPYEGENNSAQEVLEDISLGRIGPRVRMAAVTAQKIQDRNGTWGEALDAFLSGVGEKTA